MKKIRIIFFTFLIVMIIAMAAIVFSKPKPINKTMSKATSNADLAFAVLGDVHDNIDSFQEAINDLYTINTNMDALVSYNAKIKISNQILNGVNNIGEKGYWYIR